MCVEGTLQKRARYEWVNNYPITFDMAYPEVTEQLKTKNLKTAILQTFLKVLA
ncbi:hypothetical protein E2P42_02370 [Candidatus Bathyarchaeota archaeon]|nr:hypothetical protein E2P42_02370 [Candidatus Bathyarchaeota archaeon]